LYLIGGLWFGSEEQPDGADLREFVGE